MEIGNNALLGLLYQLKQATTFEVVNGKVVEADRRVSVVKVEKVELTSCEVTLYVCDHFIFIESREEGFNKPDQFRVYCASWGA